MAKRAVTCTHISSSGRVCGGIALRNSQFCYWHHEARRRRIHHALPTNSGPNVAGRNMVIPILEDADSILVSIQEIMHAIIEGRIDRQSAGLLLYALQNAAHILPQRTIVPFDDEIISVSGDAPLAEDELALPACDGPTNDDDKDDKENDNDSDDNAEADDEDDDNEEDDQDDDDEDQADTDENEDDDSDEDHDDDDKDDSNNAAASITESTEAPDSAFATRNSALPDSAIATHNSAMPASIEINNIPALRKYLRAQSALLDNKNKAG